MLAGLHASGAKVDDGGVPDAVKHVLSISVRGLHEQQHGLYTSTAIIVTAKHGRSPTDYSKAIRDADTSRLCITQRPGEIDTRPSQNLIALVSGALNARRLHHAEMAC